MTRLDAIRTRSKTNRLYLALFAAMMVVTALVSVSTIGTFVTLTVSAR